MSNNLIPALSGTMMRRIQTLNSTVEVLERLQQRLTELDVGALTPLECADLMKSLSHQFTEVLESYRRCSADDIINRLGDLKLYQMIRDLPPDSKARLYEFLEGLENEHQRAETIPAGHG